MHLFIGDFRCSYAHNLQSGLRLAEIMKLSVHHITENREFSADIGLFVRQCTDWKYSWGLGHSVPPGTSVVLVPAEIFLEYRKRYPKEDSKFVEVVYGASKHLAGCYLAGCADYLKNDWTTPSSFTEYRGLCTTGRTTSRDRS